MLTHGSAFVSMNFYWAFSLYVWKNIWDLERKNTFPRPFGLSQLTHDKAMIIIQVSGIQFTVPHIMRHCILEGHTPGHPFVSMYFLIPYWMPLATWDHSDREIHKTGNPNSQNSASWCRMNKWALNLYMCSYLQFWHLLTQLLFIDNLSVGRSKWKTKRVHSILSKILLEVTVEIHILWKNGSLSRQF